MEDYRQWRRQKAIQNLILFGVIGIAVSIIFIVFNKVLENTKVKTRERVVEFSNAVKEYRSNKTENLNGNITFTCIDGKKVIVINEITYYAGTTNTWGDIEGVDCE